MSLIPHLGAAGTSLLTILIFVALSAVSSWLQRREEANNPPPTPPGPPRPKGVIKPLAQPQRPAIPPADLPGKAEPATMEEWEREVRRMLGEPKHPMEPSAPPLIKKPAPAAAPVAKVQTIKKETKPRHVGPSIQLKKLTTSTAAYKSGAELPAAISRRMQNIDSLTVSHPAASPGTQVRGGSRDGAAAISQIKHHQTIRQALLASVILGEPKCKGGDAVQLEWL